MAHTHTHTHRVCVCICMYVCMYVHQQSLTRHSALGTQVTWFHNLCHFHGHIHIPYCVSMLPVYNLQELCDEVSVLGKLLLKQARPSPAERPSSPRSYLAVQYPCPVFSTIMCVHKCTLCVSMSVYVYMYMRVCMCGKVVRNGQTQRRDSIFSANYSPNLQTQPLYFVG